MESVTCWSDVSKWHVKMTDFLGLKRSCACVKITCQSDGRVELTDTHFYYYIIFIKALKISDIIFKRWDKFITLSDASRDARPISWLKFATSGFKSIVTWPRISWVKSGSGEKPGCELCLKISKFYRVEFFYWFTLTRPIGLPAHESVAQKNCGSALTHR